MLDQDHVVDSIIMEVLDINKIIGRVENCFRILVDSHTNILRPFIQNIESLATNGVIINRENSLKIYLCRKTMIVNFVRKDLHSRSQNPSLRHAHSDWKCLERANFRAVSYANWNNIPFHIESSHRPKSEDHSRWQCTAVVDSMLSDQFQLRQCSKHGVELIILFQFEEKINLDICRSIRRKCGHRVEMANSKTNITAFHWLIKTTYTS